MGLTQGNELRDGLTTLLTDHQMTTTYETRSGIRRAKRMCHCGHVLPWDGNEWPDALIAHQAAEISCALMHSQLTPEVPHESN